MCCILNGVSFLLIEELDFFWRLFSLEPIILDDVDLMHNFQNFDPRRLDRSSGTWDDVNRIVATAEVRWRGRSTHLCIVNIFPLFLFFLLKEFLREKFVKVSSSIGRLSFFSKLQVCPLRWEIFINSCVSVQEVGKFENFSRCEKTFVL